jgi:sulfite exporter TauE/SafE
MNNLWFIFLTGVTTGGLSCMAVQGGLLASSLAQQVEKNALRRQAAGTITIFLIAKLIAYTALGFFLGWLGTLLQLTPLMRALLQIGIGIFLIGNALRMLNVHPLFRYFVLQPPQALTRYIRRLSKRKDQDWLTPAFLGLLTVFIPCGVTQAMMLVAMGTGSPLAGALTMFSFTLGASPVFFLLVYLATRLGERLHGHFLKVAAVTVLILGLVSVEGGLNLLNSPVSYAALKQVIGRTAQSETPQTGGSENPPAPSSDQAGPLTPADSETEENMVTITIDDYGGYQPEVAWAKADRPVTVRFITQDSYSCARAVVFRNLRIQKILPPTGETDVVIPAQKAGTTVSYTCSMGMYRGKIQFN